MQGVQIMENKSRKQFAEDPAISKDANKKIKQGTHDVRIEIKTSKNGWKYAEKHLEEKEL